ALRLRPVLPQRPPRPRHARVYGAHLPAEGSTGGPCARAGAVMRRVVLATANEHKVHELRQILRDLVEELDLEIVSTADFEDLPDVAETEVTFVGNATLKARAIAEATGFPALADDSGLTVDVLGGSPGIFSARWSGS